MNNETKKVQEIINEKAKNSATTPDKVLKIVKNSTGYCYFPLLICSIVGGAFLIVSNIFSLIALVLDRTYFNVAGIFSIIALAFILFGLFFSCLFLKERKYNYFALGENCAHQCSRTNKKSELDVYSMDYKKIVKITKKVTRTQKIFGNNTATIILSVDHGKHELLDLFEFKSIENADEVVNFLLMKTGLNEVCTYEKKKGKKHE